MWTPLPLDVQTLYADLLERLIALEGERTIGRTPGSFIVSQRKGRKYVYFQYSQPGGTKRQVYVGPDDSALRRLMERHRVEKGTGAQEKSDLDRVCAALRAGGALQTAAAPARVLRALADSGVFSLGGVLVGTHAMAVLGNLLGVTWQPSLKTQDVDIAAEVKLEVAVPGLGADVPKALESLEMGFLPVPPLNPKHPSTSYKVRGSSLRVDLLTTQSGPGVSRSPVFLTRFQAAALPVPHMEFLIANPVKGIVVGPSAVLANVPDPGRFALHKLYTSRQRSVTEQTKAVKDTLQAAQVLSALSELRPGDIRLAWDEAQGMGKAFTASVEKGLRQVQEEHGIKFDI